MQRKMAFVLACTLFLEGALYGQTHRAVIRGRVLDATRTPVPGVLLKLVHEDTNEVRTATSGADGEFAAFLLPPGPYRLEIELAGYKKYTQKLALQVNQELRVEATLDVGPLSQEIVSQPHGRR